MRRRVSIVVIAAIVAGCSRKPPETVSRLSGEFVYEVLAFSPNIATQAGYHEHNGKNLDELLDDYSQESLDAQRRFFRRFRERMARVGNPEQMPAEERTDHDIIRDQIELQLLELDEIQNYRHNPTLYVELVGNALFNPFVLEYAPKPQRFRHIIARLGRVPALLSQAKQNLASAPEIWTKVAIEENEGNIGLVDVTLRKEVPEELRSEYDRSAGAALDALRSFSEFLKSDLAKRTADWRLGAEKYAKKFRYMLQTDVTPAEVLAAAEEQLTQIRKEMYRVSLPLHSRMYPSHRDPVDLNLIVGETLAKVAARHATPDTYMAEAKRDLAETREFVGRKRLLPLPPRDNLQVIETPEFMRGIYAVGGFASAPALQPELGAYYWITPIPKDWPRERIESKLREYNFYSLKLLTIHEAMPGHYVQLEYANDVQPKSRRLLRTVFGNGPYVEGWAVYATGMMLDEGYLDGSPELRLTFLKQLLRMLANAILDIRLHTLGMTDAEAMDLMLNRTFQEKEEATAKLQRAKLSSCQLPTYFVGWRDWLRLREQYQKQKGAAFQLSEFHERALKAGAVPMPALARILTGAALTGK